MQVRGHPEGTGKQLHLYKFFSAIGQPGDTNEEQMMNAYEAACKQYQEWKTQIASFKNQHTSKWLKGLMNSSGLLAIEDGSVGEARQGNPSQAAAIPSKFMYKPEPQRCKAEPTEDYEKKFCELGVCKGVYWQASQQVQYDQ